MRTRLLLAAALLLSTSPSALSQPATPGTADGAKALQESLTGYLTKAAFDNGFVKVAPDPAGYRITVMADVPLDAAMTGGVTGRIAVKPYSFVVAERSDGDWTVTSDAPIGAAYDIEVDGQKSSVVYEIGQADYSGIFSPALGTFLSAAGSVASTTMTQKDPLSESVARVGSQTLDMTATKAGEGSVDLTYSQTGKDFSQTVAVPMDPSAPEERITIAMKAAEIDLVGTGKAMKTKTILDLYAFLVAHPGKEPLIASQAELKNRLRALMPLWDEFDGRYAFRTISVETPVGTFAAKSVNADFRGDGVEEDGTYRYGFGFEGLAVDSPLVPAWATSLIPQDFELTTSVESVDLATPARLAIDDLDLAREQPVSDAVGAEILAAFQRNLPKVVFEPSRIKAADYEIAISGDMEFGGVSPALTLDIQATGMDKAIRTLQEAGASDQRALQIVGPLSMAMGFAKPLGEGRSQWLIETEADGSVAINGTQIKGPDAPAPSRDVIPDIAPTDENAIPPL